MKRHFIRVGDKTTAGGTVLEGAPNHQIYGLAASYEGAQVACPACKTIGYIQKVPPFRSFAMSGRQIALENDLCICKCHPPPKLIASQANASMSFEADELKRMGLDGLGIPRAAPDARNKLTDGVSTADENVEDGRICFNMSNEQFYATMTRLRDRSVGLLGDRLSELSRWSAPDRVKVERWFGDASTETRIKLMDGLTAIRSITMSLTDRNYVRYSIAALRQTGCQPRRGADAEPPTAAVCKPDGTYQIFIGAKFCAMPEDNHGIGAFERDGDSKLLTLIHEVSHFPTAMNSEDEWYSTTWSKVKARMRDPFCIENADNIAGYVVNVGD